MFGLEFHQAQPEATIDGEHVVVSLDPQCAGRETEYQLDDPVHLPHAAQPGGTGDGRHREIGLVEQSPGEVGPAVGPAAQAGSVAGCLGRHRRRERRDVIRQAVERLEGSVRRARIGEQTADSHWDPPPTPEHGDLAMSNALAMTEAEPW